MNDEQLTLLCETIGVLAKVYLMARSDLPLTEKQLNEIKSIINTYVEIVE